MLDILVYDMEVFKYDWFITIKSLRTQKYTKIHNDLSSLVDFYEKNNDNIWAGHNINRYDNVILKCLLLGIEGPDLKTISNSIIEDDKERNVIKLFGLKQIKLYPMDAMQDAIRYSLKEIEGYFGMSIEECDIPFDIDRPLTNEEVEEVFKYNTHDVDAASEEITLRLDRQLNKIRLLNEYSLPMSMIEYTNAKLCAEILQADYTVFKDGRQPYDLSVAPINIKKYSEVVDFFTKCEELDYTKNLKLMIANTPHVVSSGGIHGAIENYSYEGEIWLIDVSSYYPNIMINFNLCSRAMSNPENFKKLVKTRMDAKELTVKYKQMFEQEKDENKRKELSALANTYNLKSSALKLPINTVSGCMKAKFNKLFDERNNNWMCITGQLLLIDLIESMEDYMTLIQSNTDGIIIIPHDKEMCDKKIKEWEDKTGLILEKTIAKKIYQKDVNNYILLNESGKVKTKGGFVAQYHNDALHFKDMLRRNLDIIDDAVVDYLLYNKPLEETIVNDNNNLINYQIIKKLGGMYDDIVLYMYDDEGNLVENKNVNRINRVFATTNQHYGKLMKKHEKKTKYDCVEGLPERCLVLNGDVRNLKTKDISIDYDWYVKTAKDRVINFILTDEEKKEFKKYSSDDLWLVAQVKLERI